MNWRDIQIFLFGFYTMGTIIDLIFICKEIGSINQRVLITILLIIGLGTLPLLNRKKKKDGNK